MSAEGLRTRELVSREVQRANEAIALVDERLNHLVVRQGAQMDDHVRERFLQSLKYRDFNQRRNQIDSAHTDTLKWVYVGDNEDDEDREDQGCFSAIKWDSFSNWLRSTDTIYWISGKPGSGKTTLVKYILSHPRTRMCLDFWSPDCEIASHYFWRPGSPMQKNLEGLFCSLLYQLLSNNKTALEEVMSLVSGPKDSFTDWSSTELRSALSRALSSCKQGVCLFLDGIDEIEPDNGTKDGIPEFLEFVAELSQKENIKICLASRPEPYILEMKLSMHPRLRLQDLNYADLMAYTKERVKYPQTKVFGEYHDLAHSLVARAEGVFLWLLLAIKSINEGFSYHDSIKSLKERINRLPKGLNNLYEDMWRRAGVDRPDEYRQTAALYFKFIIATKRYFFSATRLSAIKQNPIWNSGINIFDLMLATTSISSTVLDAPDEPSKLICGDVLQQKVHEVEEKLKIYCMGLIEVRSESHQHIDLTGKWYGEITFRVRHLANSRALQFIHRTASDFLTDTESGHKILDHDKSSDYTIQFKLIEAFLAKIALFPDQKSATQWAHELRHIRQQWQGTEEWGMKDWDRLVLVCEKLANSRRLLLEESPCDGINFLRALADFIVDDEFIISKVKTGNLTEAEKSAVLLSLSNSAIRSSFLDPDDELESRSRALCEFLWAGADPNWQFWEKPWPHFDSPFQTLQTPWRNYLLRLIEDFTSRLTSHVKTPIRLAAIARILVLFVSRGAELDDMVNICMEWNKWSNQWHASGIEDHGELVHVVFASIPAYLLVEILADAILLYSRPNKVACLESCAILKQACTNHSSSKPCRVIGKVDVVAKFVLSDTTDDIQLELGNKLLESLKWQLSSTNCFRQKEVGESILNDETWLMRARGGSQAVREWLVDLDLLQCADENRRIE